MGTKNKALDFTRPIATISIEIPQYFKRLYWGAKERCTNPNCESYSRYGGRGIQFRFNSYTEFFSEIGERPSNKYSLDRIYNDGHYEIGNVRWATRQEQNINTRVRITSSTGIKGISLRKAWGYHKDRYIVRPPGTRLVIYSGYDLEKAKQILKDYNEKTT